MPILTLSAMLRLSLTHLCCTLNSFISFKFQTPLYTLKFLQAARSPTGLSGVSCPKLQILQTVMVEGSTFCSCLHHGCSGGGENPSAPLSSLNWQWKEQHCSLWAHLSHWGSTVWPGCDTGVHSPPSASGAITGILINQISHSSSQTPVHPTFYRDICQKTKGFLHLSLVSYYREQELLLNMCLYMQADRKAQSCSHLDNTNQKLL